MQIILKLDSRIFIVIRQNLQTYKLDKEKFILLISIIYSEMLAFPFKKYILGKYNIQTNNFNQIEINVSGSKITSEGDRS